MEKIARFAVDSFHAGTKDFLSFPQHSFVSSCDVESKDEENPSEKGENFRARVGDEK
jgi:hypothetical protein